jgi:hypothetical protein
LVQLKNLSFFTFVAGSKAGADSGDELGQILGLFYEF